MTPSTDTPRCDYLHLHSFSHRLMGEPATLDYINSQISALDAHMAQLYAFRRAWCLRSRQYHNLLAPVHTLPVEILSIVFEQLVDPDDEDGVGYLRHPPAWYQRHLAQALVLSSVSSHFRRAALDTPKLWRNVPVSIPNNLAARAKAAPLLRHCLALTSYVNLSIVDSFVRGEALSDVDTGEFLTPDVTWNVKNFALFDRSCVSFWIDELRGSTFPMLDAINIPCLKSGDWYDIDFGTIITLTRLNLHGVDASCLLALPSSLLYLDICRVSWQMFISVLYQCPNLVEYGVTFDPATFDRVPFIDAGENPLTLTNLKRLSFRSIRTKKASLVLAGIRLPSLETLQLDYYRSGDFTKAYPLLYKVSATLTTLRLIMKTPSDYFTFNHDELYRMCDLPLRKLEKLEFSSAKVFGPVVHVGRALARLDDEYCKSETRRLCALRTVLLCCSCDVKPQFLLDLLQTRMIGGAFLFCFNFDGVPDSGEWSMEVREELRTIVGGRRIEVRLGDLRVV